MPCDPLIENEHVVGFVCHGDAPIRLAKGVWMEWHHYFGPTFFTRENCEKEIEEWYLSPRICKLFDDWLAKKKEIEYPSGKKGPSKEETSAPSRTSPKSPVRSAAKRTLGPLSYGVDTSRSGGRRTRTTGSSARKTGKATTLGVRTGSANTPRSKG